MHQGEEEKKDKLDRECRSRQEHSKSVKEEEKDSFFFIFNSFYKS